jgi:pullulanase
MSGRLRIHYHRPGGDTDGWTLWTWNDRTHRGGHEAAPSGHDDFGLIFDIDPASWRERPDDPIGFLPRFEHWVERDPPNRRWTADDPAEIWVLARRPGWSAARPDTSPFVVGGFLDGPDDLELELYIAMPVERIRPEAFFVRSPLLGELPVAAAEPAGGDAWSGQDAYRIRLRLASPIDLSAAPVTPLEAGAVGVRPGTIWPRHILDRPEFRSEAPLGVLEEAGGATRFRVFAPTADRVDLSLFDAPVGGVAERHLLVREVGGTWSVVVRGSAEGRWYSYRVSGPDPRFTPDRDLVDPEARCVSAHDGRALVSVDRTPVRDGPTFSAAEAVVYELHVRDATIDASSGVGQRGRYLGLAEMGTRLSGSDDPEAPSTGLDHLVELGVNVVQILPIQDFENDESADEYHWGYMPVHFNVPDGAYATTPTGPARVVETKRMIDALHAAGIKVVLDVVYNHTAERPGRPWSFDGFAPGYYYRLHADGAPWNGSGTGNEFRTEAPMARRFVIESLEHWVRDYRVDGFRFDLMGLFDLETVRHLVERLRALKPDLLLYGEPWTGGASPVAGPVKGSQRGRGFAVFNDHFRNGLKGDLGAGRGGWLLDGGAVGDVRRGLEGSVNDFADTPLESVNYVECHDNHTLWDRLRLLAAGRADLDEAALVRLHRLAGAAVLLARGLPFLHAGQEFLRTKGGVENSYDAGDAANAIDWRRKVEYADVVAWYRGLVRLRRAHPLLRRAPGPGEPSDWTWLETATGQAPPPGVVAALLGRGPTADAWAEALLAFHPGAVEVRLPLPAGQWRLVVDGDTVRDEPLASLPEVTDVLVVPPRSAIVLARG